MFGTFLSWLNDRESDTFVVCTANDVAKLPPEFARAERFDSVFFLDLPSREEKDAIWSIYHQVYQIEAGQDRPDDTDWTGAEIKSVLQVWPYCLIKHLSKQHENVVPVAVTAAESISKSSRLGCRDVVLMRPRAGSFSQTKTRKRRKLSAVGPSPSAN